MEQRSAVQEQADAALLAELRRALRLGDPVPAELGLTEALTRPSPLHYGRLRRDWPRQRCAR